MEAVLENEIDSEKICVVSGDGVETASGIQDVKDTLDADEGERTESDSDDPTSQRTYPSWGRSKKWTSDPDDEDPSKQLSSSSSSSSSSPSQPPPPLLPQDETSIMHRLKSAFSVFLPEPTPPVRPKNHRRTPSYQPVHNESAKAGPGHLRLSTFGMSSVTSPPPSPSIRRWSASHPDITSLVKEWASSGPANQTLTFKPS